LPDGRFAVISGAVAGSGNGRGTARPDAHAAVAAASATTASSARRDIAHSIGQPGPFDQRRVPAP
jgi:hypothetical protein